MGVQLKPKGSVTRAPADWFQEYVLSVSVIGAGFAPFTTYCGVFNDAKDGSDLVIVGMVAASTTAMDIFAESFLGDNGATHLQAFPMDPTAQVGPGKGINFGSTFCIGTHNFDWPVGANIPAIWPYPWPVAIVPPGYSFALQGITPGANLSASFWWYPIQQGTTA